MIIGRLINTLIIVVTRCKYWITCSLQAQIIRWNTMYMTFRSEAFNMLLFVSRYCNRLVDCLVCYVGIKLFFANIIRTFFIENTVPHTLLFVLNWIKMWCMLRIPPRSTRHSAIRPRTDHAHCPPFQLRFCLRPSTARSAVS